MNQNKKLEDEINFKKLFKDPIRLFGWIYPYFLVVALIIGIYFVKNLNKISFNEQDVSVPDTTNTKTEIVMKKGGTSAAVDFDLIKNPTPAVIARGKELFMNTCQSCHGADGNGDGPAGGMLNPKPRNFHDANGWINGRNIDQMYKTVQEGIKGSGMSAYEYIPAADRFAILSYVRTFAQFPPVTDDQLINLDMQYQISAVKTIPNQIPISLAESKLAEENSEVNSKFVSFQAKINSSIDNPEAQELKKYSLNLSKVYTAFVRSNGEQNYDSFINDVMANPINAGFDPSVVELSKDQWKNLYDYLKSSIM